MVKVLGLRFRGSGVQGFRVEGLRFRGLHEYQQFSSGLLGMIL